MSSGGSGGKSLELMQSRLQQQGGQATPTATSDQPNEEQQPTSQTKRPGKDFAAMAMNAKNSKPTQPPAALAPAAQPQERSLSPKGKDFGAMAARNNASAPRPKGKDFGSLAARVGQTPTPSSEAEATRQRQIDAARKAAGYTPMSPQALAEKQQAAQKMKLEQQKNQQQMKVTQQLQRSTSSGMQAAAAARRPSQQQPAAAPQPTQTQQQQIQQHLKQQQQQKYQQQQQLQAQQQKAAAQAQQASPKPPSKPTPQPKSSESKIVGPGAPHMAPLVGQRLNQLLHSLDPNYTLDAEAEEEVLHLAQNFLDSVVKKSSRMSQHRGSKTLDVQDVQFVLAKQWGIVVPGLGPPTRPAHRVSAANPKRKTPATDSGTTKKSKLGS